MPKITLKKFQQLIDKVRETIVTSNDIVSRAQYPYYDLHPSVPSALNLFKQKLTVYRKASADMIEEHHQLATYKKLLSSHADFNDLSRGSFYNHIVGTTVISGFGIGDCGECAHQLAIQLASHGFGEITYVTLSFGNAKPGMETGHQLIVANLVEEIPFFKNITNQTTLAELLSVLPKDAYIGDAFLGFCFSPKKVPHMFANYLNAYGGNVNISGFRRLYNATKKTYQNYQLVAFDIRKKLQAKDGLPDLSDYASPIIWRQAKEYELLETKKVEPHGGLGMQEEKVAVSTGSDQIDGPAKIARSRSKLDNLLQKYKLINDSPSELAKGLRRAAALSNVSDLSLFLEMLEDINAQDSHPKKQYTALHLAVENKAYLCVEMLLKSGAKFTIKNASGKTVQEIIEKSEDVRLKELLMMAIKLSNIENPLPSNAARDGAAIRIDLHRLSRPQAEQAILDTLKETEHRVDVQKLFIITGRGKHPLSDGRRGVLFDWLPAWLQSCQFSERIHHITTDVGAYEITLKALPQHEIKNASIDLLLDSMAHIRWNAAELKAIQTKKHKTAEDYTNLANYYMRGIHIGQNVKLAIDYLNMAAQKDHLPAIELLGGYYQSGVPGYLKPNYKKAAALFERALKLGTQNEDVIQNALAACYSLGQGLRQNDRKAFEHLKKSSELGSPHAQFSLAMIYLDGVVYSKHFKVEQDFPEAYRLFNLAAKQGFSEAYRKIALMHIHGEGVEKSISIAFQWYKKGAAAGDVFCIYNVGIMYLGNMGVFGEAIDPIKGVKYLQQAVELGDGDAALALGMCFLMGRGVANDLLEASRLCQLAKARGTTTPQCSYWLAVIAVIQHRQQEAIAELQLGIKQSCQASTDLLQQLTASKWFEKDSVAQFNFVHEIIKNPGMWLGANRAWLVANKAMLPIFAHTYAVEVLEYCEAITANDSRHQQFSIEWLQLRMAFLYQCGLTKHHTALLNLQGLMVVVYLNQHLIDKAESQIVQSIMPNLLDTHSVTMRQMVQNLTFEVDRKKLEIKSANFYADSRPSGTGKITYSILQCFFNHTKPGQNFSREEKRQIEESVEILNMEIKS